MRGKSELGAVDCIVGSGAEGAAEKGDSALVEAGGFFGGVGGGEIDIAVAEKFPRLAEVV
jgi:hypothetical protein